MTEPVSEMVERVKAALFASIDASDDLAGLRHLKIDECEGRTGKRLQDHVYVDGVFSLEALAIAAIKAMREPNDAVERAIAGSQAKDDEGTFPRLADQLDYSGDNKIWTVVRQAWADGIDAALGSDDNAAPPDAPVQ